MGLVANAPLRVSMTLNSSRDSEHEDEMETVCPKPKDEPHYMCRLLFSSYAVYTKLSGWSSIIPLGFANLNLNSSTCLTNLVDERGQIDTRANQLLQTEYRKTLRQVEGLIDVQKNSAHPVYVQVVAKRKVDAVPVSNRLFLIPILVVADESGYCILNSVNEGLKVVYNAVEVGDYILLSNYQPIKPRKPYHHGLFSEDMCLNLEMKFQFHSARHHYINRFIPGSSPVAQFKLNEKLFDAEFRVKLPNEVEKELNSESTSSTSSSNNKRFFDFVGVINYVGRMQRFKILETTLVESLNTKYISVPKFFVYRWISVIDKKSAEIPVKIFIYNQTLECQNSLVPGAPVVISHCKVQEDSFTIRKFVATTEFSHIFLGEKFSNYFTLRPLPFWDIAKQLVGRTNYIEIMSRTDIALGVGGTLSMRAVSEEKLLSLFRTKSLSISLPMARRESQYVHFKGLILKATEVLSNGMNLVVYHHPQCSKAIKTFKTCKRSTLIENFDSSPFTKNVSWYSFIRRLPPFDRKALDEPKTRQIVSKIVNEYEKYCEPLGMPAKMSSANGTGFPPLASLDCLDGPPYLVLDIFREDSGSWLKCMWKIGKHSYSGKEMLDKIEKAKDKVVVCIVEVKCIEEGFPLEVVLLDFAIIA